MRLSMSAAVAASLLTTPAAAQEHLGVVQQPQTLAPNVSIDRPQPPSCGAAPNVDQINKLTSVIRRMFAQPAGFNAAFSAEARKTCQRNRVAAYLIRTIAANNWAFVPVPGLRPPYPPLGGFACGPAASSADLNVVIGKLRPLFADPGGFNANIALIAKQPCIDGRATLYLVAMMVDNGLTFRR